MDVYLGTVACATGGTVIASGWPDGLRDVLRAAAGVKRRRMRVWLSGALARPFIVEPVHGLRRWAEAQALADAQANAATGLDGPCRVSLEDWPGERPALAVAVEQAMLDRIEDIAASEAWTVASIRPWWARALGHEPGAQLVSVAEHDALTVLAGDAGSFALATTCTPKPQDETATLARLMLACGAPATRVARVEWQP